MKRMLYMIQRKCPGKNSPWVDWDGWEQDKKKTDRLLPLRQEKHPKHEFRIITKER